MSSEIKANTISEVTSANGVSIDGVKLKDNSVIIGDGGNIGSASDPDAMSISSAGIVTKSQVVGFGGMGIRPEDSSGYATTGQKLYCNTSHFNSGHFVNASGTGQGEFTCPVSGAYFVFFAGLCDDNITATELNRVAWYVGSTSKYIGYDNRHTASGYDGMLTCGGILSCSANDKISVQVTNGKLHVGNESGFSIFLLG